MMQSLPDGVSWVRLSFVDVFGGAHSVQLPGGAGAASGGQPEFIEPLARAAVAVGVNGVFVEVHDAPEKALSDGANALRLSLLAEFWKRLQGGEPK